MTQRKSQEYKEYFPYLNAYSQQIKVIESTFKAFNNRKIALIEAPPGSGKTVSVLVPALIFNPEGKIFWVGSSHRVYENLNSELIKINQEKSKEFILCSFIGKKNMCLMDFAKKKTTTDEFYDNCSAAI